MCGRYGRWSRRQRVEELLGIEPSGVHDFPVLYNITPGTNTWDRLLKARLGRRRRCKKLFKFDPIVSPDTLVRWHGHA